MGNGQSSNENNIINFDKNELKILYKNFIKLDQDGSGNLEPNEFFDVPQLKDNPIVQRIIKVFDRNNDGKISFYEFVLGNIDDKYRIAFSIYDMDNDGFLSNGDLFKCLKMLVGDNLNDIQVQQLVDRTIIQVDKDLDGKLSYDEFVDAVKDMKMGEMFSVNIFG